MSWCRAIFLLAVLQYNLVFANSNVQKHQPKNSKEILVLLWNLPPVGFWRQFFLPPELIINSCDVPIRYTSNRENWLAADAIAYNVPHMFVKCTETNHCNIPPKQPGQLFIGYSSENRLHHPKMDHTFLRNWGMDIIMDHKLDSDVPMTLLSSYYFPQGKQFVMDFFRPPRIPTMFTDFEVHSGASFPSSKGYRLPRASAIYSNCGTKSNREKFLRELLVHFPVDSFGKCVQNLPTDDSTVSRIIPQHQFHRGRWETSVEKIGIIERYAFDIVMENAHDEDWITEKIWQALIAGTVPVYSGAPNIAQFLPCPNKECIVDVSDFESPAKVAEHLHFLLNNPKQYQKMHQWRTHAKPWGSWITTQTKFYDMVNLSVDTMHCRLCNKMFPTLCSESKGPFYDAEINAIYDAGSKGSTEGLINLDGPNGDRYEYTFSGISEPYDIAIDNIDQPFRRFALQYLAEHEINNLHARDGGQLFVTIREAFKFGLNQFLNTVLVSTMNTIPQNDNDRKVQAGFVIWRIQSLRRFAKTQIEPITRLGYQTSYTGALNRTSSNVPSPALISWSQQLTFVEVGDASSTLGLSQLGWKGYCAGTLDSKGVGALLKRRSLDGSCTYLGDLSEWGPASVDVEESRTTILNWLDDVRVPRLIDLVVLPVHTPFTPRDIHVWPFSTFLARYIILLTPLAHTTAAMLQDQVCNKFDHLMIQTMNEYGYRVVPCQIGTVAPTKHTLVFVHQSVKSNFPMECIGVDAETLDKTLNT